MLHYFTFFIYTRSDFVLSNKQFFNRPNRPSCFHFISDLHKQGQSQFVSSWSTDNASRSMINNVTYFTWFVLKCTLATGSFWLIYSLPVNIILLKSDCISDINRIPFSSRWAQLRGSSSFRYSRTCEIAVHQMRLKFLFKLPEETSDAQ